MLLKDRIFFFFFRINQKSVKKMEFEPVFPTCQSNATKAQTVCFNKKCSKNKGDDQIPQCPEISYTCVHVYTYVYGCVFVHIVQFWNNMLWR